jgi:hypothetical protein
MQEIIKKLNREGERKRRRDEKNFSIHLSNFSDWLSNKQTFYEMEI